MNGGIWIVKDGWRHDRMDWYWLRVIGKVTRCGTVRHHLLTTVRCSTMRRQGVAHVLGPRRDRWKVSMSARTWQRRERMRVTVGLALTRERDQLLPRRDDAVAGMK